MPQVIVFINEKEDDKVKEYSRVWKIKGRNLSKQETIKKMIREFK